MSDINLSLDEIIKKRNIKINAKNFKNPPQNASENRFRKSNVEKRLFKPAVDARLKLTRKRTFVGDARDRLSGGLHARSRLRGTSIMPGRLADPLRRLWNDPIDILEEDATMDVDEPFIAPRRGGILKTFKNDLRMVPRDWDRPAEAEMDRDWLTGYSGALTRRTVPAAAEPQGILKRRLLDDDEELPIIRPKVSGPRTLSERFNNDGNARAERIKALRARLVESQSKLTSPASSNGGYRIIVSNLRSSVTEEDIQELFEDIGPLVSSKITQPGVAEVVFRRQEDALEAVEAYHNRQLDGQPMKCLLVKNSSSSSNQKSGNKVELDLDVLKNALHYKSHS